MIKEYFHAPKETNFVNHTSLEREDNALKDPTSESSQAALQVSLTMTNNPLFLKSMISYQEQTETMIITSTTDKFIPDERNYLSSVDDEEERATINNTPRHCNDCFKGEICVAMVGQDIAVCRDIIDENDSTGCGGFCRLENQECQQIDINIFR